MKNIRNALKLFTKAALNPLTIFFGLFMAAGMALAFIVDPEKPGTKEYLSMIGAVGMGHIGALFLVMAGAVKTNQNKFYASAGCAKEIYTTAPIIVLLITEFVYDIVIAVAAGINLGGGPFADVVFFNSLSGGMMLIGGASIGKIGLSRMYFLPYIGFLVLSCALKHFHRFENGFGLSPALAVIAALAVYAFCIAFSWMMTNIWWNKGNRISVPVKFFAVPEERTS